MTVIVQAKSIPVTKALRQFVRRQADKVSHFSGKISQITVSLERASRRKNNDPTTSIVKYHVKVPGKDIVVKRTAVDMYDAIVDATDRVVRQVRKLKEKRIQKKRQAKTQRKAVASI